MDCFIVYYAELVEHATHESRFASIDVADDDKVKGGFGMGTNVLCSIGGGAGGCQGVERGVLIQGSI